MKYITSNPNIMGGEPVIIGTRIPIEVILYRLKDGNSLDVIHDMYNWVEKKVLAGAIDEAIQTITTTLHDKKFYKHKLLLDENVQNRTYFPSLNERFDLKHVVADYKKGSIRDDAVYELARKEGRLLVTYNIKDFVQLSSQSTDTGIIGLSAQLSAEQIDTKLTALLQRSTPRGLYGKITEITGESAF